MAIEIEFNETRVLHCKCNVCGGYLASELYEDIIFVDQCIKCLNDSFDVGKKEGESSQPRAPKYDDNVCI